MHTIRPRYFRLLTFTASLLACLGLRAQNTTSDDYGNTTATAAAVTLPSVKTGTLEKAGDVDFFKFTLTTPTVVTVSSGGTTDVVGTLWLGGAKGAATSIVTDNDSAGAPNFRCQQLLPAGTHYLSVFPAVYGTLGGYTVNFTVSAPSIQQPDISLGLGGADLPAGTTVDFGTAAPGGTVNKDFSVGNAGNATLIVYGLRLSLTSTLPAGASFPFRVVTSPAPSVEAGRQTTFRIAFQSNVAGTYSGKLTVVSNDGDEIFYDIPLQGVSSGPLPPSEIEIRDGATTVANNGTINVGSTIQNTRLNKTITIANTGTGELKITSNSLIPVSTTSTAAGSNTTATTVPMAFSIYNSTIPTSVPAGGQATFQISLFNLVAGNYAAKLTLYNNDSDENPTVLNFTGTVSQDPVQGEIGLKVAGTDVATNSTVAYGNNVTGVGISKDFVFTNSGTATLNLTSWQLSIPPPVMVSTATTTTVGSTTATVANGAVLAAGMGVSGPFVSGTSITAVSGNTVTFSSPATVAISNAVLYYYVGGPNATVNAFRFDSALPASLAAGASATVKVTYLPLQAGDHTATLKVYNNDADENPYTLTLTGHSDANPNPGDIAVTLNGANVAMDSTVDWGGLPVGMTALRTFLVSNTGTGELRLTGFSTSAVQPLLSSTTPMYFYFGGTPSPVLPAGQSGSLVMIFKPTVADAVYKSTLVISSTDPDENPYRINLTGTGSASTSPVPDIDVTVNGGSVGNNGSFAFGTSNSGTMVQKSLTLYNTGTATLTITGATVTQPVGTTTGTPQPFSAWVTPPVSIAPGSSYSTWLNFSPTVAGTYNATVQLTSNDPDESPYTINVSGTAVGTVTAPEIDVSLAGVDVPTGSGVASFGTTASGTPVSKQFTINNTGNAALTLSSWLFQQPSGTTTAVPTTTTLGSNVATVSSASALVAGMTVSGPFPTGTSVVSISGTSVTFSAAASSTASNSVLTYFQPGVPAVNPFQFTGTLPTNVAAGASATFTVTYAPLSAGSHSMIVRFSNNDLSENPYLFTVTGSATGIAPTPEVAVAVEGVDIPVNTGFAYGGTFIGVPVSKQFVISNIGTAALSLSGWSFVQPVSPVATVTGATTLGSPTATLTSVSNLAAGMVITGPFPVGTTISSISGNVVTFSAAATSTLTSTTFSVYPAGTNTVNPFVFSGTLPSSVAAGGTATVTVNYSPTAVGNHSMNLRFTNNDSDENPFNITLTGSATVNTAAPEIGVSVAGADVPLAGTVAYGSTNVGTPVSKQFVISNTGNAALNLSGWSFGIPATPVTSTGTTTAGSTSVTLASTNGLSAGMVVLGPFAAGSTVTAVSGSTVTLSTAATSTLAGVSLSFYPAGTNTLNPFQFVGTLPTSVAAGASTTITVNYAPSAAGTHSMLLRFNNNDSNENPYVITLTGSAVVLAPEIGVSVGGVDVPLNGTLAYGATTTGTVVSKQFVIANTGNAALNLSGYGFYLTAAATNVTTNTTLGSTVATVVSSANLSAGMTVVGPFASGTSIVSISGTNVTFSSPAVSTIAGVSLAYYPAGTSTVNPFQFSGTLPATVAAGSTATLTVNYAPTSAGSHSMILRFNNNDSNENPYSIVLTGSATASTAAPDISVFIGTAEQARNSTLDFGTIARGTTATKDLVIKNTGASNLTISNVIAAITPTGSTNTPAFSWQIISGSSTVVPAGSTTVRVTFKPGALSTNYSSSFNINNNDPDENPYGFTLTGASLATDSEISVSYNSADLPINGTIDFGSAVTLGSTVTKSFTVSNTGAATLAITGWGTSPASGSYPTTSVPPFYITNLVSTLAPGASATINVVYRPVLVSTADNWTLTMTNSDADEGVYKINLTAAAVASATPPEVGVSAGGTDIASGGSLAFSTAVNVAVTKDIIISNTGTDALLIAAYWTVNSTPTGSIAFTTVQAPPASIPAGGTGVWRVKFLPTAAGSTFAAKLTLQNTDPDEGAYVINLTGTTTP
ncbi:choice-of-anchor D domain-containing protein [Prosthecobacter sp.]|uniref:choice-of-anchor D domain-containing protein n=1 Tax=Prosthecobacter sp. TaxID=1965333 RepID=UPI00378300B9